MEMVRHTVKSLGPRVVSTRMLRDYVEQLYAPTARTARVLEQDHPAAQSLARWKARIRSAWPSVRVEHVEASGIEDVAEVGATMSVQVYVALGDLGAEDVDVQVVHGRVGDDDTLDDTTTTSLQPAGPYDGQHRFAGDVRLERTGPFGYTVRVLPRHELLAAPAEMGLVAWADPPAAAVEDVQISPAG